MAVRKACRRWCMVIVGGGDGAGSGGGRQDMLPLAVGVGSSNASTDMCFYICVCKIFPCLAPCQVM